MFRYSWSRVRDRVLSIRSLQQQGILSLSELSVIASDKHGCMWGKWGLTLLPRVNTIKTRWYFRLRFLRFNAQSRQYGAKISDLTTSLEPEKQLLKVNVSLWGSLELAIAWDCWKYLPLAGNKNLPRINFQIGGNFLQFLNFAREKQPGLQMQQKVLLVKWKWFSRNEIIWTFED